MAMQLPGNDADGEFAPMADINVTPLVDVMLVLLIIFMVTAPLMMSQLPIQLPKASLHQMGKPPDPVIISMDKRHDYYIDSHPVPTGQLTKELHQLAVRHPDNVVYVRADKSVAYGQVVALLQTVGQAGFYKVSLLSRAPH